MSLPAAKAAMTIITDIFRTSGLHHITIFNIMHLWRFSRKMISEREKIIGRGILEIDLIFLVCYKMKKIRWF
jgi:hypothetical protein